MANPDILELINRRRRQVLVHSTIYYELDKNLITDAQWSRWAVELEELQKQYPDIARRGFMAKEFENFEHSSGQTLPFRCSWAINKALQLVSYAESHKEDLCNT